MHARGKISIVRIHRDLIGQGVGLAAIFVLGRGALRHIPGKTVAFSIDRHSSLVADRRSIQLDIRAHGIGDSTRIGGGCHFFGNALEEVCQIIHIIRGLEVIITAGNVLHGILGVVVVLSAQVNAVNVAAGILGISGFCNGRIAVIRVVVIRHGCGSPVIFTGYRELCTIAQRITASISNYFIIVEARVDLNRAIHIVAHPSHSTPLMTKE